MVKFQTVINLEKVKEISTRPPIDTLSEAIGVIGEEAINLAYEKSYAIYLTNDMRPISYSCTGQGTLMRCPVDQRSIVITAALQNAAKVVLLHTHPADIQFSGPSQKDVETTKNLKNHLEWLGIELLDSVILSNQDNETINVFSITDFINYVDEENNKAQKRSRQCQTVARVGQYSES